MPTIFDFRLTALTGVAVTTTDQISVGTIYLTPKSNIGGTVAGTAALSLYTGSTWELFKSAEISLALTATSGTMYDVFVYNSSGLVLETVAWTNTTTRATVLDLQDGVLVKHSTPTHRYVGSFYANGTNTTEDSLLNRLIANYYNRADKECEWTPVPATGAITTSSATPTQVSDSQINYVSCNGDYFLKHEIFGVYYYLPSQYLLCGVGTSTTTLASGGPWAGPLNYIQEMYFCTGNCEIPAAGLVSRYMLFWAYNGGSVSLDNNDFSGVGLPGCILRATVKV